jgi:hypothetical protein
MASNGESFFRLLSVAPSAFLSILSFSCLLFSVLRTLDYLLAV